MTLSIGKIRGMQQIANPAGVMTILALDQRGSLARMLGISTADPSAYGAVRDFKLLVLEHLARYASGVLLDAEYAVAEAVARGVVPGSQGIVVALEQSGYTGDSTSRVTELLNGWSVGKARRMGASAVKLLVDYNPESGGLAERQERLVAQVIAEARAADIALLLEPVTYALDSNMPKDSAAFADRRPGLIVETARRLGALGPDMLKMEFPCDARYQADEAAWAAACADLDAATPVPWAMLSAGVDFATFKRQVQVACKAGACGYVAGRSFWRDAVGLPRAAAARFLASEAAGRMAESAEIASRYAHPWHTRYANLAAAAGPGWFREYPELVRSA